MKTKNKRIFCFLAAIFVVSLLLATTCFAWTRLPFEEVNNTYCFAFKTDSSDLNFCIYAYSHDGIYWYVSIDGLTFNFFDQNALDDLVYVPIKFTSPTESDAREIVMNVFYDFSASTQGSLYYSQLSSMYNSGFNFGFEDGFEEGFDDGSQQVFDTAYNEGYTDGATDSGFMKNTLVTIFSSPYYILNEVFDFEIFDINVASILMFIISIIIVGFVIKIIV